MTGYIGRIPVYPAGAAVWVAFAEEPTPGNPLGVKGGGEGGITPATAAVVNALCDALAEAGVEDLPMPVTTETVWRALRGSKAS